MHYVIYSYVDDGRDDQIFVICLILVHCPTFVLETEIFACITGLCMHWNLEEYLEMTSSHPFPPPPAVQSSVAPRLEMNVFYNRSLRPGWGQFLKV